MATSPGESIDATGGAAPGDAEEAAAGGKPSPRGTKMRRRLVNTLAVLTCFSMLISAVAIWSHRLLLNTDEWVKTVGPLAEDPAVTDAVATALTDEIFQIIKPEKLAKDALPDKADFLAAPLSNALHGFVLDQSKAMLQTEQFQKFWVEANRVVHENAVALLRGETVAGFSASNGVVTLNLLPLLSKTMRWITDKAPGVFGDIQVPDITAETPPDQARAELSAAVGVPIPPNFGVYTVFQSDQLAAAQRGVQLFDRLVILIVLVTIALLIATIALSPNRRRTLVGLGIGTALSMMIANALTQATEREILNLIGGPQAREAAEATMSKLINDLRLITNFLFWVGVALVLIAFLTGQSRLALGIRHGVQRALGHLPRSTSSAKSTALPVLTQYAEWFKFGGVAVAVIVLVAISPTVLSLLATLVVLGLYELFVTIVTTDRDAPGGDAAEPPLV